MCVRLCATCVCGIVVDVEWCDCGCDVEYVVL